MKTAFKSINKRQCTEAFDRGDWKSHNFHGNPTFCSKVLPFVKKVILEQMQKIIK